MSQNGTPLRHQDTTVEEEEQMAALLNQKEEYEGMHREILVQVECKIIETQSAILSVPNEVICLIFEKAQLPMIADEDVDEENLMEVVVSHVCHHWRMISLGYPKLWSRFLCTNLSPITLERFDAYMERSAARPLRLWFDFRRDSNNPVNPLLFDTAINHVHRWQHVTLYSDFNRDLLGCLSQLQDLSAPMLEHLVLSLFNYDRDNGSVTSLDTSIFKCGASKLTFLRLDDCIINAMPPLSNISTLWLESCDVGGGLKFDTQAFIGLLSLPSLEHVLFAGDFAEQTNLVRPIRMPNLKRFFFSSFTAIWSFLPNIRAPHLETLMVFSCTFDQTTLNATLDQSYCFPALKNLWIVESNLIPTVALNFVKLTSQATEVMIAHSVDENFLTTIVDDLNGEEIWPRLKTLTCNIYGCTEIDPYLAFAKSQPKKSFKFKLHHSLLDNWEKSVADQFSALKEVCTVEGMNKENWLEQQHFWPRDMEYRPSSSDPEEENPCYVRSHY